MEKYDYQEDLEETFYSSKQFKKIKQLVYDDINFFSKYQKFKNRLYRYKTNLGNKIIKYILKHNKLLNLSWTEKKYNNLNNVTGGQNQEINQKNNKFVFDYYTNFLKNDNTIFKISLPSFLYSTLLMVIGKIISDPIIFYNFIYDLLK